MLVYVAGPYMHPDPVSNLRRAIDAGEEVFRLGHTPHVPHLNLLWDIRSDHSGQFWYDYDLVILERCDALVRIPGFSLGADMEWEFAQAREIPTYGSLDALAEDRPSSDSWAETQALNSTVKELSR